MWRLLDQMAQMEVRLTSALAGRRGERPPRRSTSSCSDGSAPSYLATTREAANRAPALEPVVHRRRQALAVASDVEQEPSGGVTNEEVVIVAACDSLANPPEQRLQHNTHGTSIAPLPTATSSSTTCPWADAPNHDKVDFTATAVSLSADLPVSNNLAVLKNHLSLGVDLGNYDQEKAVQHVASGTPADTASSLPTACILS